MDKNKHPVNFDFVEEELVPDDMPVPVHEQNDDGDWECKDARTGETIDKTESPTGPNGEKPDPFEKFSAKLLRDIEDQNGYVTHEEGDEVTVQIFPGGRWSVVEKSTIIITEATEGEDFEFV